MLTVVCGGEEEVGCKRAGGVVVRSLIVWFVALGTMACDCVTTCVDLV